MILKAQHHLVENIRRLLPVTRDKVSCIIIIIAAARVFA